MNHQVCHGVPGDKVAASNGDIVNIDITVIKDGWHGDTSRMFYVGEPLGAGQAPVRDHLRVHVEGHRRGAPGRRASATSAPRSSAMPRSHGFSRRARVLRPRHRRALPRGAADPALRPPGAGPELVPGMTFTIEPMINAGKRDIRQLADGWTIVTARPLALRAMGAHRPRHRRRLRGAHRLRRHARRRPPSSSAHASDERRSRPRARRPQARPRPRRRRRRCAPGSARAARGARSAATSSVPTRSARSPRTPQSVDESPAASSGASASTTRRWRSWPSAATAAAPSSPIRTSTSSC